MGTVMGVCPSPKVTILPIRTILTMKSLLVLCLCLHLVSSCLPPPDPCAECCVASGRMLHNREVPEENTYEEQIQTLTAKLEEAETRAGAAERSLMEWHKNNRVA